MNTVLPWHREAAKSLYKAKHNNYIGAGMIAHIIAGYDPHAAQEATTLRLLEQCADRLFTLNEVGSLHAAIRAHLAAMKGGQP